MTTIRKNQKGLHIILWVAQILLGGMFLMAGVTKATQPIEMLGQTMTWVHDFSAGMVRVIGIAELLGALGLLLPALLRIRPALVPLASSGLFSIMVFAIVYHIIKGEYTVLGFNLLLGGIAFFIAWGRYKKVPILPKSGTGKG